MVDRSLGVNSIVGLTLNHLGEFGQSGHPEAILGAEVHAAKSDRDLIGFYVDRPCHLSGRMSLDDSPSAPRGRYELDVPQAGLTWVEYEVAGNRIVMKPVPAPHDIVYLIFDDR